VTIGVLQVQLSIPEARSLKDKRAVLRSLKDRIMNKMNVSAAETDHQDLWQSAELTFVTVAAERVTAERRISDLQTAVMGNPRVVLLDLTTEFL
jgi:uncharacterized protein